MIVGQAWLLAYAIAGTFERLDLSAVAATVGPLVAVVVARGPAVLAEHRAGAALRSGGEVPAALGDHGRPVAHPGATDLDGAGLVSVLTQGLDALDGYFAAICRSWCWPRPCPWVGVAILTADWLSALIVALTVPLIPVFMVLVGWMTQTRVRRRAMVQERLAHHFADLVAGLPTLQVRGAPRRKPRGCGVPERHTVERPWRRCGSPSSPRWCSSCWPPLSVAVVAVGIGLRVVDGNLTLFIGLFVLILAPEAYLPLRQVACTTRLGRRRGCGRAGLHPHRHRPAAVGGSAGARPRTAAIEVDGVSVTYPGASAPALAARRWCSGRRDRGRGRTQRGGQVDPAPGAAGIRPRRTAAGYWWVARRLDELDLTAWRAALAWVPQQPALVAGTIGQNVRLGAPDAPDARVRSALIRAGAAGLDLDRVLTAVARACRQGRSVGLAVARARSGSTAAAGSCSSWTSRPPSGHRHGTGGDHRARSLGVSALVVSHRPAVLAAADRVGGGAGRWW